jgi:hypothetical protein
MKLIFWKMNVAVPSLTYPDFLFENNLLKRKISKTTIGDFCLDVVARDEWLDRTTYYVKPVNTKLFDCVPISCPSDCSYFKDILETEEVWVSEKIDIISEYRCFVHNGLLKYACNYSGAFLSVPYWTIVYKAIDLYKDAPVSYTIDVAILKDGSSEIVEINDFWAIGSYGLYCINYAQMLLDRYCEIVSIEALP